MRLVAMTHNLWADNRWPERQPALERALRDRFASYGYRDLPEAVMQQADVPRGATVLDNPVGSAPGLRVELGQKLLFAMPGPPHELAAVGAAAAINLR
ncbi:MAG: hypothetical protein KY450_12385 [Actinobacteria bacterium]|nr:hypothetical protein [Actinomycetota bacterium]